MSLNLSQRSLHREERSKPQHKLYAIINHHGEFGSGHYTAHVLRSDGNWWRFDDAAKPEILNDDDIVTNDAYVAFYSRENDNAMDNLIPLSDLPHVVETSQRQAATAAAVPAPPVQYDDVKTLYNCPDCDKTCPTKHGILIHYGIKHGGKLDIARCVKTPALSEIPKSLGRPSLSIDKRLNELKAYKATHGHANVKSTDDLSLYQWILDVRKKKVELNTEQIAQLDKLGFNWTYTYKERTYKKPKKRTFEQNMNELKAYKATHGHMEVKYITPNESLYNWIRRVRQGKQKLNSEQIEQLNELGFNWNYERSTFDKRLNELKAYKATHGHANVKSTDDLSLYHWCLKVKRKEIELNPEPIAQLTGLRVLNRYLFSAQDTTNKIAILLSKSWWPLPSRLKRRKRRQYGRYEWWTATASLSLHLINARFSVSISR